MNGESGRNGKAAIIYAYAVLGVWLSIAHSLPVPLVQST